MIGVISMVIMERSSVFYLHAHYVSDLISII